MRSFRSLKSRLFILLLIVALPGIGIIFYQAYIERSNILTEAEQQAISVTQQIIRTQKSIISETRSYLQHLATTHPLQQPSNRQCSEFLADIVKLNPLYVNIGVPLANGDLVCNASPLNRKVNVFDRSYFQHSLKTGGFAIGQFQFDRVAQTTSVNFSYPVLGANNETLAVAVAVVSLDWWSKHLTTSALPEDSMAYIFDVEGTSVASFPVNKNNLGIPRQAQGFSVSVENLIQYKSGRVTERVTGIDGLERVFTHAILYQADDGRFVTLSVGIPFDDAVTAANRQFFYTLISFSMIMALVAFYTVKALRQSILLPLESLTEATASLEAGQLSNIALSPYTTSELLQLQQRFRQMAEKRLEIECEKNNRNEELNSVFKAFPDHFYRLSVEGLILDCKGQFDLDQETIDASVGRNISEILPAEIAATYREMLAKNHIKGQFSSWEYSLKIAGKTHIFEARMSAVDNSEEFVVVVRNITERKRSDALIWDQAHLDSLTSLPNRSLLYERAYEALETAKRNDLVVAVLFLDLDQFKDVNDTIGHFAGDLLLQQAAKRLSNCIKSEDTLARQGGDEFTILLAALSNVGEVNIVASRILKALSEPFQLDDMVAYITVSIGVSLFPDDACEVDDLFRMSDQAMYAAKASGRNRFQYFTESMQRQAQERMQIVNELRVAVEQQQFVLFYQPIINLASGSIQKAEALIRWRHPEKGLIGPNHFIQVAEETHLIIKIGEWVFQQAVANMADFFQDFSDQFQVSINVSPVQFSKAESGIEHWGRYLRNADLPMSSVVMEITENLLMDASDETAKKLAAFSDAGIEVAIDDFGTGYSSLSYIREYDVDYLKIDRSFITNLAQGSDSFALCEAIIVMAHKLDIKVIAEGIETLEQKRLLQSIGCDFGQGYLFSPPVEKDFFRKLTLTEKELKEVKSLESL